VAKIENIFGKHVKKIRTYDIQEKTNDIFVHPNKQNRLLSEEDQFAY
jgi:hypothetical protein